jgi:cytochrome c5
MAQAMRSIRSAVVAAPLALAFSIGCGPAAPPATTSGAAPESSEASAPTASAGAPEIARIHRSRCGACHQRVEPGARTRPVLEEALSRHHTRVHLTDEQWAAMIDYLAAR